MTRRTDVVGSTDLMQWRNVAAGPIAARRIGDGAVHVAFAALLLCFGTAVFAGSSDIDTSVFEAQQEASMATNAATTPTSGTRSTQGGVRTDEQIILKQLEVNQRSIYAMNLGLTDKESKAFWPIYDEYEVAFKTVTDMRIDLLNRYADKYRSLTNSDAAEMLASIWQCEHKALEIREEYARAIQKVLPSVKALRYVQLQSRIDNRLMDQFMSLFPLASAPDPRSIN